MVLAVWGSEAAGRARRAGMAGLAALVCLVGLALLPGCLINGNSLQVQSGSRTGYAGSMVNGSADHRVYEFKTMDGRFEERLESAGGMRLSASASIGQGELDIELVGPDGAGVIKWMLTADQPDVAATVDREFAKGVYKLIMKARDVRDGRIELEFGPQPGLIVALDGV